MPTYQFLLHTTGVHLPDEDGNDPVIGFYSWRRVRAADQNAAYDAVMAAMDHDPKIKVLILSGHEAGLQPTTVVKKIYEIPWWRAILPWRQPGLCMYSTDDGEEDETTE